MHRTFFLKATAVATLSIAAVAATGTTAEAQRLNFNGAANVQNQPGSAGANLLIDFLAGATEPTIAGTPTGNVFATPTIQPPFSATIMPGTNGVIQDLVASSSNFIGLPVSSFLTIGGYSFSLTNAPSGNTFGPISLFDIGTGTLATFGVRGFVTGGAYGTQQVAYQGAFTAQFAGQRPGDVFNAINSGGTLPVAFSAEFNVVPEPSTYALLATGIGALGVVARRRRQA